MGVELTGKMLDLFKRCDKNSDGVINGQDYTSERDGDVGQEAAERNQLLGSIFNIGQNWEVYGCQTYDKEQFKARVEQHYHDYAAEDEANVDEHIEEMIKIAKNNAAELRQHNRDNAHLHDTHYENGEPIDEDDIYAKAPQFGV